MKLSCIMILVCLLAWSGTACASEAAYEKAFSRGMAALEDGNYGGAATEFRTALTEHPDDAEATLYLGIALSRSKDPQADEVLIHALSLEPANPLTNLELGIRNFNNGVFAEAGDYFENLITIAPGSEYSTLAEEYLRRIKEKTRAKRWGLRFTAGMQYDSNVILNADGTPLPQGVSRRSDWRGILNAGLDYSLLRT
ncbi:MAG TPA: tetratricopeptide repeat protein, partial [Geobacteraceae bacterium]